MRRSVRRWLWRVAIVALVTVLIMMHRPVLVGFANLFRSDDPAPSDSLLIMAISSDFPGKFYASGGAKEVVLVPIGLVPFTDLNQYTIDREILIRQGVPSGAIRTLPVVPPDASFRDIARRAREDLATHPVSRLTITVRSHRSARAQRIFRREFAGTGVDIRVAALSNHVFNEENWYQSDEGMTSYFGEFIETIRDFLL